MDKPQNIRVIFSLVVGFCLLLVGWWVFFLLMESARLDRASAQLAAGQTAEALRTLGAEEGSFTAKAEQWRLMFTTEGAFLGLVILVGVVMLYRATLREQRSRLEQERFLTGATHHLKTPLATVRLGLESMLAGSMPEAKQEKYLHAMLREVSHLEKDLTNLLTAGGLQATAKSFNLVEGDLAEDVRSAAASMADRFEAAGVELRCEVSEAAPIRRDPEALHLVLHNLLDNAVKYSPSGSRVDLRLLRQGNTATIEVQDQGQGIRQEEQGRVFERFFRGVHGDHQGGSGVGLYLVYELISAHGGAVDLRSEGVDRGTCVRLTLPLLGVSA